MDFPFCSVKKSWHTLICFRFRVPFVPELFVYHGQFYLLILLSLLLTNLCYWPYEQSVVGCSCLRIKNCVDYIKYLVWVSEVVLVHVHCFTHRTLPWMRSLVGTFLSPFFSLSESYWLTNFVVRHRELLCKLGVSPNLEWGYVFWYIHTHRSTVAFSRQLFQCF